MSISKFNSLLKHEPKKLFLVDGLGAILSAVLYFTLLSNWVDVFGMPKKEVYILGMLAILYAVYSLACYKLDLIKWRPFLKAIAIANILHKISVVNCLLICCFVNLGK